MKPLSYRFSSIDGSIQFTIRKKLTSSGLWHVTHRLLLNNEKESERLKRSVYLNNLHLAIPGDKGAEVDIKPRPDFTGLLQKAGGTRFFPVIDAKSALSFWTEQSVQHYTEQAYHALDRFLSDTIRYDGE